jgi:hypothetical protein
MGSGTVSSTVSTVQFNQIKYDGLYRVNFWFAVTTSDATATFQANIVYTNADTNVGAGQLVPASPIVINSTGIVLQGSFTLHCKANTGLFYTYTFATPTGTPVVAWRLSVERIG